MTLPAGIDPDLLRTFSLIAEEGSFTRVARQVGRTQSAVSMQVQRLEALLGRTLLLRARGGSVQLTAHGRFLLSRAREVLALNDDIWRTFREPSVAGRVRLGTPDDYALRYLPTILMRFAETHPAVEVDVISASSGELVELMRAGELDLTLCSEGSEPPRAAAVPLWRGPLVWVTSERNSPHRQDPLPLALGHPGCFWRRAALLSLERAGRRYRIAYTSSSQVGTHAPVMAGLAVTVSTISWLPEGLRPLAAGREPARAAAIRDPAPEGPECGAAGHRRPRPHPHRHLRAGGRAGRARPGDRGLNGIAGAARGAAGAGGQGASPLFATSFATAREAGRLRPGAVLGSSSGIAASGEPVSTYMSGMSTTEARPAGPHADHPSTAPISIAGVALTVRDLAGVEQFYRTVLGLAPIARGAGRVALGAGGAAFLHLVEDRSALPDDPAEAGLFHTAFLMPARADLARWLAHAGRLGVPIDGASDHGVSEAIYLSDPEGNGIEVYADRPRASWQWQDGQVSMTTRRLATDDLLGAAEGGEWAGAPAGARIGHVHLRVGDIGAALGFYRDRLGLDLVRAAPSAAFLSTGSYHHHIAVNTWHSRGAGPRDPRRAGLAELTLAVRPGALPDPDAAMRDPWGTELRLARA